MLLQALHSCRGARFVCCPPRLPPQQFQPHTYHLQHQAMAPQAGKAIQVLAAAEATAAEIEGLRLDAALLLLFPDRWKSSTALKKVVRRGEVLVNGQVAKTDDTVKLGDRVEVTTRVGCAGTVSKFKREQLRRLLPGLDVAWEDDHMAVVIKPQGLVSQGPRGEASVQGRVKYCLQPTPLVGALGQPVIVHRLDVGTGGLLMVAKTRAAATRLTRDLAEHNIQKRYLAVVLGHLTGSGVIDHPVGGCPAVSLFRVEGHRQGSATFDCLTYVSLWPKTGRTHQLRKHMAYIGHPILGDLKYKNHRKPDCQATAADISTLLPQLSTGMQQEASQQLQQPPQQPAQLEAASQQAAAACAEQQAQQCMQEQHKQQQPLPVLEVVAPILQLPVYDGGNPYHSARLSAAGSQTDAQDAAEASTAGSPGSPASEHGEEGSRDEETGSSDGGSSKLRGDVLQDGTVVGTCLWAVQLQLRHPVSGQLIDVSMGESPLQLFDRICALDGAA